VFGLRSPGGERATAWRARLRLNQKRSRIARADVVQADHGAVFNPADIAGHRRECSAGKNTFGQQHAFFYQELEELLRDMPPAATLGGFLLTENLPVVRTRARNSFTQVECVTGAILRATTCEAY